MSGSFRQVRFLTHKLTSSPEVTAITSYSRVKLISSSRMSYFIIRSGFSVKSPASFSCSCEKKEQYSKLQVGISLKNNQSPSCKGWVGCESIGRKYLMVSTTDNNMNAEIKLPPLPFPNVALVVCITSLNPNNLIDIGLSFILS